MNNLYTEEDLSAIRVQLKKRYTVLAVISGIFLIGTIVAFIFRQEILTIVSAILTGITVIFITEFFCRPLRRYARHMDWALHGRSHEADYVFSRVTDDASLVDGISCRDLFFLGDADKHGQRDRLFYWDTQKEIPSFSEGQEIRLKYYDKFVIGWQAL